MSRCAGDRREHDQTDSPSRLMEIFYHAQIMKGICVGGRNYFLLFSLSSNPLLSTILVFFGNFVKFAKSVISRVP